MHACVRVQISIIDQKSSGKWFHDQERTLFQSHHMGLEDFDSSCIFLLLQPVCVRGNNVKGYTTPQFKKSSANYFIQINKQTTIITYLAILLAPVVLLLGRSTTGYNFFNLLAGWTADLGVLLKSITKLAKQARIGKDSLYIIS